VSPELVQFESFASSLDAIECGEDSQSVPVFLDMFSGPNCPLSKAMMWCGWKIISPIDIAIDEDFDVTRPAVQKAIIAQLHQVHATCAAMDCSTKTRAREKQPGPLPLRTEQYPRGLPDLCGKDLTRVTVDNEASDFSLAIQDWMDAQGRAALRENPLNSLHWHDPVEVFLESSGSWSDMIYDACVFQGARRKCQRIRHNVNELSMLPSLRCGHIHHPHEWHRSGSKFPTKEEAEYTPSLVFTLAVCLSTWAVRRGFAIMGIARLPPIQTSGDVRSLLDWPAATLRTDLMTATALHLGLRPDEVQRRGVPRRLVAADVFQESHTLPESHVYIGPGHFSHRWQVGQWQNPFHPGADGTHFETVLRYMEWVQTQPQLMSALGDLKGCTLVCDCPHNRLCHGDILAALFWEKSGQSTPPTSGTYQPSRWVQAIACGTRMVSAVTVPFSQESIVGAFKSLCWFATWDRFQFPMIEDLLNQEGFLAFIPWRHSQGRYGLPAGPRVVSAVERPAVRMSLGVQTGAAASNKAAPPLVPFGLGADGHFLFSTALQDSATPFEQDPLCDDDLLFAADQSGQFYGNLRAVRQKQVRLLTELGDRWTGVTTYLRQFQAPSVASATAGRHLGLIGLLMLLVDWPDPTFMEHLVFGFPSIGYSPHVACYNSQPAEWIPPFSWQTDATAAFQVLVRQLQPSEFDEAILEAGIKDEKLGFCGPPMSLEEVHSLNRPVRLIRRFCIQQPGGKLRVIDDAAASGQSALSSDSNKLDLCSSIQPGIHVRLLSRALLSHQGLRLPPDDDFETGGEDLPHAYRSVPVRPDDSWAFLVAYWNPDKRAVECRHYYGLLFGLPLAVTSFNRWPRFLQSLFRRLGFVLCSMYFDDLTVQDLKSSRGSAQWFCCRVATLLGSPFSEEKHQAMSSEGDFLGLWHSVSQVAHPGHVTFWVRDRLIHKVEGLLSEAYQRSSLPPGVAAKLYGCLNFLGHGCWGKVGRSGLVALQERQACKQGPFPLTEDLMDSLQLIRALLALKPSRHYDMQPSSSGRFLAASDAAQDAPRDGSAGCLFLSHTKERLAYILEVDDRLFNLWDSHPAKIAQLELVVVLMSLAFYAPYVRQRHGFWFIDNVAALMALIRGRSSTRELDSMAGAVHAILCGLGCSPYFEWVQSADNWSDGISRQGLRDSWMLRNQFRPSVSAPLLLLLQLPVPILVRTFSFL